MACSSSSPSGTPGGGGGGGGQASNAPTAPQSSTGSGGGSGAGGSGGPGVVADPCTLLTQAEVAGVIGFAVGPGDSSQDPHACAFTYQATTTIDQVSGTVTDNVRATEITKDCQAPSGAGLTITAVSGVGDLACSIDAGILGSHIDFVSNGQGYEVSVLALGSNLQPKFPAATAEAMEKALALDVVAKL